MKLREILNETPINNLEKIKFGVRRHPDAMLNKVFARPTLLKGIMDKFDKVPQHFDIYGLVGIDSYRFVKAADRLEITDSALNPGFYLALPNRKAVVEIIGSILDIDSEKIETMIPGVNKDSITVYLTEKEPNSNQPSHISAWGLAHDLVHVMTNADERSKGFEEMEDVNALLGEFWEENTVPQDYFIKNFCTMKSKDYMIQEKTQFELSTELFVQWLMTGAVTFQHPDKPGLDLRTELKELSRVLSITFEYILEASVGKIYVLGLM